VVRCILESLAMEYRWVAERLDDLTGRHKSTIHIIGGGSRNALLNQLTADATHRTVVAGPVEATAIGNVLAQALALGYIRSLEEGREVVRRSFDVVAFHPQDSSRWEEAYQKYLKLKST
jgi:sugar (pentulose or hexulose) kinase